MAEWLSSRAPRRRPSVSLVRILGADMHCSSNHTEAASHMPQLEGPTTKNIQLCNGGLWGEKGKNKIFKKKKIKLINYHHKLIKLPINWGFFPVHLQPRKEKCCPSLLLSKLPCSLSTAFLPL